MPAPSDDLEFFTTVASARTLTEAARHWSVSVAVVSRRLHALETRLGVALASRGSRGLELTAEGDRYRRRAAELLQQRRDLEASLNPDPADLHGMVRLVSTVGFGRLHLAPLTHQFHQLHPGVEVLLELTSLPLSASLPGFDIAVRVGQAPDSTLVMRKLLSNRRVLVAAPRYLEQHGTPQSLKDLNDHNCLVIRENDQESAWHFLRDGKPTTLHVSGAMACNDGLAVTDWCLEGAGIAMRSLWHVAPHLDSGSLVQVLPEISTPNADIIALTDRGPYAPPRTRALLDFLQQELPQRVPVGTA